MPDPVVLLAWELGAGLGHARRLLNLAHELKRRGFRPVVAARELWRLTTEYNDAGIPLFQAPAFGDQRQKGFSARSYADLMAVVGYQNASSLWASVVGWESLLKLLDPALVIGDYCPILALAAYGRVPFLAIGSGFVLPPPQLPSFPALRRVGTRMAPESELLANAVEVQRRRGLPSPTSLPALVAGDAQVVCTFPETDVYAKYRVVAADGPLSKPPPPLRPLSPKACSRTLLLTINPLLSCCRFSPTRACQSRHSSVTFRTPWPAPSSALEFGSIARHPRSQACSRR